MSRPCLKESVSDAVKILKDHYDLKTLKVTQLDSFGCRNFAVEATPLHPDKPDKWAKELGFESPPETSKREGKSGSLKLVLKVFNEAMCTAQRMPTTQQQIACSQTLVQQGFLCPRIIHTNKQEMFANIASNSWAMLMTMLPGKQLGVGVRYSNSQSSTIFFELGVLLASMHQALKDSDLTHLLPDASNPWCIENVPLLVEYIHCIKDEDERNLYRAVIVKFRKIKERTFHLLDKGVIHGDIHDHNIIVDCTAHPLDTPAPASSLTLPVTFSHERTLQGDHRSRVLQKYGIIDFEDMSYSVLALELARLISDMMIADCFDLDLLEIGGHIIAGYCSVNSTPVKQFRFHMYESLQACMVQYIVLGVCQYGEEGNEYCLLGTHKSRLTLFQLKDVETAEIYRVWGNVLTKYGQENLYTDYSQENQSAENTL